MLKVWGRKTSSNVQAVMWCIGELELPHERYDVGHKYGGNDTPEFLAMNPNGLVPVLRDNNGPALFEAGAILRYLANRYAEGPFWPSALEARTLIDMWAEWVKVSVIPAFSKPIFWPLVRLSAAERDPAALDTAVTELTRLLKIAEDRLSQHHWLVGDDLTLADIHLGSLLYRYYNLDFKRAELPALRRYYDRLTQRPAYQQHVMVSFEELRN